MKSEWQEYKDIAIDLRKTGQSLKAINQNLGVPVSTLSGWFKNVKLSEHQKQKLLRTQRQSLIRARGKAADWHRAQKALRMLDAKREAMTTLQHIKQIDSSILDLTFAMLYFGEGTKTGDSTVIASSNPIILRFAIAVLKHNYGLTAQDIRCDLHLRDDQDGDELKLYWSHELNIPLDRFKHVAFDKRSIGKKTYSNYKGVCVLSCGHAAIQRKMVYLYTLFCENVISDFDRNTRSATLELE